MIPVFHGYSVRIATDQDSVALNHLLASIHSEGLMPLIEQRSEPFFKLLHMHQGQSITFVIEKDNEVVGCISNVVRKGWFNNELINIAYTCDLRVKAEHRKTVKLTPMFQYMIDLLKQKFAVDVFYCAVIDTNKNGKRATELASAEVMSRYTMKSIQFVGRVKPAQHKVQRATPADLTDIATFLQRHAKRRVFGISHDLDSLTKRIELWPGFSIEDFYFIRDNNGRIIATAAPWNCNELRQTRLLAYHGHMIWLKRLYNFEAKLRGFAPLPEAGGCFRYTTLTHVEVDGDDPSLLNSILKSIYQDYRSKNLHMMSMLLVENSPLSQAFADFRTRETPFELRVFQHPESEFSKTSFVTDRPGFEMALH